MYHRQNLISCCHAVTHPTPPEISWKFFLNFWYVYVRMSHIIKIIYILTYLLNFLSYCVDRQTQEQNTTPLAEVTAGLSPEKNDRSAFPQLVRLICLDTFHTPLWYVLANFLSFFSARANMQTFVTVTRNFQRRLFSDSSFICLLPRFKIK